jgi:hypothetical protein
MIHIRSVFRSWNARLPSEVKPKHLGYETLEHWSSDRELNGVRDENELDELPGLERK